MGRGCAKYHEALSAFVDETLPPRRWSEVAYHLAGCKQCRDEVVAIREVRSALSASCSRDVCAPSSLASRLEAIAGDDSSQPLYLAGGPTGELPSKRRARRRRLTQSSAAALVVAMSVVVLAIILAPDPRLITDPLGEAREQFAMQTTAISVQEAVGAVLLAQNRGAKFGLADEAVVGRVPQGQALPISADAVDALLDHAQESEVSLTGTQRVWVTTNEHGFVTSDVLINRVAGEGSSLVVLDRRGERFMSTFLPEFRGGDVSVPAGWDFFTFPTLDEVAGRPATIIEARKADRPVARWWLDVESGLTLRSERYDSTGEPTIVVAYDELTVGDAELPENRTQLIALSSASTGGTRGWCVGFASCPYTLAGLPLVAYASSEPEHSMSLVYSDGIQTLIASWVEGMLLEDGPIEAMAAAGLPTVTVWQAGRGVVSVATNGSPELVAAAMRDLPEPAPHKDGMWVRLTSGMGRLTGLR